MKTCKNCGAQLDDQAKFCRYCGKSAEEENSQSFQNTGSMYAVSYTHLEQPVNNAFADALKGLKLPE